MSQAVPLGAEHSTDPPPHSWDAVLPDPHCSPQPQSWDGVRPLCTWNALWVQVGTSTLRPWLEQQHCASSSERAKGISSN